MLGCTVKAPSTLGTFLLSFRWGHICQLDRVTRELLARAWAAGDGPGEQPLTQRADSGFYSHADVNACRAMDLRFSVTVRQQPQLRTLIETIPEADWTPIPYWLKGGADVAETSYTSFRHKGDTAPVRLIVQVIAHNLARWTARLGLGEAVVTTKTLRRRCFALAGRLTRSSRRWPWSCQLAAARARIRALPLPA